MDSSDPLTVAWMDLESSMQRLGDVLARGAFIQPTDDGNVFRKRSAAFHSGVNYAALTKTLFKMRQTVEAHPAFNGLFGDPAFSILLDLFLSHLIKKSVSVTDTAISGNIPTATAIRWLGLLEKRGYIERKRDVNDSRRSFVSLSQSGFDHFRNLLDQVYSKING